MKNEGAVRQQLKMVKYRHQRKILRDLFKKYPSRCHFSAKTKAHDDGAHFCLYGTWKGELCDLDRARSCHLFEPKQTKDEAKLNFDRFLQYNDLPEIAQSYPDIAALMWVLDITGADLIEEDVGEEVHVSHLLVPIQLWSKPLGKNATPVALEFPVDPESSPYLVTSSSSLIWVPEAFDGGIIRAAIRIGMKTLGELYRAVVLEVAKKGLEKKWGNVHDLTPDGIVAAVEHVRYYDLGDVELLASPQVLATGVESGWWTQEALVGVSAKEVAWLPDNIVVAVPQDRTFVGFVSLVGVGSIVSVVHNPSRGIGVALKLKEPETQESKKQNSSKKPKKTAQKKST